MFLRMVRIGLLLLPLSGHAGTFCVGSESSLRSAMNAASASIEGDDIRLLSGSIAVRDPVDLIVSGSLTISGGWNTGCAFRTVNLASTLLGKPQNDFSLRTHARALQLDRLRFIGWNSAILSDSIANLPTPTTRSGEFHIMRSEFSAMRERGLELFVGHHDLLVENSIFSANAHEGLKIWRYGSAPDLRLVSNFNTLADNEAGVWMFDGSPVNVPTDVRLLNTVSTRTVYAGLSLAYFNDVLVRNTTLLPASLIYATISASSGNNVSGDPGLDANLRPVPGSILIDAGAFDPAYAPSRDHEGNVRVRGVAPDIGAFEY